MVKEKEFITKSRIWYGLASVVCIFFVFVVPKAMTIYFSTAGLVLFSLFIASLLWSCKVYKHGDTKIVLYSGFFYRYIKVNGKKYDEHNTLSTLVHIYLHTTLPNGDKIQATISVWNRISLKINDVLATPTKLTFYSKNEK